MSDQFSLPGIDGLPAQPAAGPVGDDVTVPFGGDGRGYVCAARSGHGSNPGPANPDANRAAYVWRTDDGTPADRIYRPPHGHPAVFTPAR